MLSTVGHSTRTLDELVALVKAHGVEEIVDVRRLPRSRRHPHFNVEALPAALAPAGLTYVHAPALGGLRRGRPDSVNRAWKNRSFRAYADYMQTATFAAALDDLLARAGRRRVTLMCAEAVWWRCHRSLIADAVVARGVPVVHLGDARRTDTHALRPWARVEGGRVTYPGQAELFSDAGA